MQLSGNGPLIEVLMRNLTVLVENTSKFSAEGDLLINYNNIDKVLHLHSDTLSGTVLL